MYNPYREPRSCEWRLVDAWGQWQEDVPKCGQPGIFEVDRSEREDGNMPICVGHLEGYLFLYGPQKIEHWGELGNMFNERIQRKRQP